MNIGGARPESQQLARNTATSYGVRALLGFSALLLTPYLFRRLGVAGFGTWSVMFTVATVFSLLEVGFNAGVTKFVAERRGAGRHEELGGIVGVGVVLMALLGVFAFAASAALALFAQGLAAPAARAEFRDGMLVLGAVMLVRFPAAAYAGALIGYQRFDLLNAARAVQIGGFPIAAVVVLEAGGGIRALAVAFAALLVVEALLYMLLLRRLAPGLAIVPRRGLALERRRLGAFASLTLLADSMAFIGQRMDTVVIAAVRGAAAAGPFAAAVKLQSGLQSLTLPFVNLLMPMVAELKARGDGDRLVRRLVLSTRVVLQITLPVAVALALFAHDFVDLWLGGGAPSVTAQIVIVLILVQIVALTSAPSEKVLVGLGRVRVVAALAIVEGLGNLGLSIALVTAYGAIGAALGTAFTAGLLAPVRLPLACRAAGLPTRVLLRDAILPAVVSSLPGIAAMVAVALALAQGDSRLIVGSALGVGLSAMVAFAQLPAPRVATIRRLATGAQRPG